MKEEDEELVVRRIAHMVRRNPETGELETWCEHKMGKRSRNPYTPWKNKETMEIAKEAGWPEANLNWIHVEGVLTFVIVCMALHLVFNWWLSYKLFTRSQVIKPKFRLL